MSYKVKKILKFVAIFMAGMLVCGGLLHLTGSELKLPFIDNDKEENLIEVDKNYIKSQDTNYGVTIDVNDKGAITLKGTAGKSMSYLVQTVELEAGEYQISGMKDVDMSEYYLYVLYDVDSKAVAGTDNDTFEITEKQTVKIMIDILEDTEFTPIFGNKIEPCLVALEVEDAESEAVTTEAAS